MDKKKVLFMSRGRGSGHAVPDAAIGQILEEQHGFDVCYASYATGAEVYRRKKMHCHDLGMTENNSYTQTIVKTVHLLGLLDPDFVIVHEEFGALAAAHLMDIPVIFISDWMPPPNSSASDAMQYADAIFIFEGAGFFHTPYPIKATPQYLGPFARRSAFSKGQRSELRRQRSIAQDALVVLVAPGGFIGEDRAPLVPLILPAFMQVKGQSKVLYWIGGKDYEHICRSTSAIPEAKVLRHTEEMQALMSLSDVVVTRGTRATTVEAAALAIPTISLSHGANPIDDSLVARIKSNLALNARATTPEILVTFLMHQAQTTCAKTEVVDEHRVAALLAEEIGRLAADATRRRKRASEITS